MTAVNTLLAVLCWRKKTLFLRAVCLFDRQARPVLQTTRHGDVFWRIARPLSPLLKGLRMVSFVAELLAAGAACPRLVPAIAAPLFFILEWFLVSGSW